MNECLLTAHSAISPFGIGATVLSEGLRTGRSALSGLHDRFLGEGHVASVAAVIPGQHFGISDQHALDALMPKILRAIDLMIDDLGVKVAGLREVDAVVVVRGHYKHASSYPAEREYLRIDEIESVFLAAMARIGIRLTKPSKFIFLESTCASGVGALGQALDMIRYEGLGRILVFGFDFLTQHILASTAAAGALAPVLEPPERSSRPFSQSRAGMVRGEAGVILLLESRDAALARGAQPILELAGYAQTTDAQTLTSGDPAGRGLATCMSLALQDAKMEIGEIGAIKAHGTGTKLNDRNEARALNVVFPNEMPPVFSLKGQFGHTMYVSALYETILCESVLESGVVPGTFNCEDLDSTLDLAVSDQPTTLQRPCILANSSGFGGHNGVLIIRKSKSKI